VVFRSEPSMTYPGVVARVGQEADRETREFIVDVRLLRLPPQWAVGQRAEVYIETARVAAAVLVPERMVQWRDGRSGVYVNERGRAVWHDITLGLRGQNMAAVTQGLAIGMQTIAPRDPTQALSDGRRVRVQ